ncbi:MAG: phosphatidylglycerophosphatase A family protein [Thiotrichales bacterium]
MKPGLSDFLSHPVHFLAFGAGSGLSPRAPGTMGTLAAIPVFLLMSGLSLLPYLSITILLFAIGIWICGESSSLLGVHDHSGIVWDEIVGFLVTMVAVPAQWVWILAGFLLFRLFDIWKPWPIRLLDQHVHGGFGIMVDDLVAGIFAAVILQLLMRFFT